MLKVLQRLSIKILGKQLEPMEAGLTRVRAHLDTSKQIKTIVPLVEV
jgi:hypothetical protein